MIKSRFTRFSSMELAPNARKTWSSIFRAKSVIPSIETMLVAATCRPDPELLWNSGCSWLRTSAGTRVSAPISYYCLRAFRAWNVTAGRPKCIGVHLFLSVQVMSVFDKESKPYITPCSSKVHLLMVCSSGSILTSIGIPTLLP